MLAGPTCARTLAEHGADVLRIGAAHLPTHEFFDMDTGHGKRWANLDLKQADDRARLESLVTGADVFSEGFRPGAMARLGFAPEALRKQKLYVGFVVNDEGSERLGHGDGMLRQIFGGPKGTRSQQSIV